VINRADLIRAQDGTISLAQVRFIVLDNVLVDTGATTLCLSMEMITKLGLELLKELDVTMARGLSKARIF
jgi:predicted aspartyl protease